MSDLPAALPSPHRSRLARRLLLAVAGFLLIAVVAGAAHSLALRRALGQLHEASRQRLEVESARLDGLLSRFDYLPSLLETSLEVLRLLDAPENPALRREVSRYLKALNAIAGADNLYVLDASGSAVAAADFDQAGTPMGQDLSYRPYMREALAKGRGAFYGVGITSRRAGYYLSYAMPGGSRTRGVATVKVDLQALERGWRDFPGGLMMLDEHSVVILASREEWKYRPRVPLSEQAKAEAARSRRYGSSRLQPLLWRSRATLPEGASRVIVDARPYLATELPVNDGRWRLVLLADEAASVAAARWAAASAGLSTAVLLLVIALASQRRRAIRQRLASREALQAAYDSLEAKVQERTAELKAAQSELVHAGKLAVLGQMSAGMAHELNQPLAALHTLSDNAALLIERGRLPEAQSNLERIGQLVQRLARLTGQLKVFAHKSGEEAPKPVRVQQAIGQAASLLSARLRAGSVEMSVQVEPPDLAVACDDIRLEQVLGNLLGNAVNALEASDVRRIEIIATCSGPTCTIAVRNSGPCIDPGILARLFEPFVTSKPAGKGLGLGLVISSHIVRAFGGNLSARNLTPTGVEFIIELPCAMDAIHTA